MKKFYLFLTSLALAGATTLTAQNDSVKKDEWKFGGQFQMRSELDGRDFMNKTHPISFSNTRVRFNAEKTIFKDVTGFIQIQDSRVWGMEGNTIKDMKNLDLHQGYVTINNIFNAPLSVQAGRFSMKYGSERWLSPNEWNYIARAFDGVRGSIKLNGFSMDLFGATQTAQTEYIGKATPSTYSYPEATEKSFRIYGVWANLAINKFQSLELLAFNEKDSRKVKNLDSLNRYTVGLSYNVNWGQFKALAEGAYQFGKINETIDIAAYNIGLEASYNFNPVSVGVLVDLYSGTKNDEASDKTTTFNRSLGGGHKFQGFMDYFSDAAAGSGNRGVNDFCLNVAYQDKNNPFSALADFHYFMTNTPYVLRYGDKFGDENSNLGTEIDLRFRYQIVKSALLELGASAFLPGDVSKDLWYVKSTKTWREDASFWTYLSLKVDL
jgi:hypothetical protein